MVGNQNIKAGRHWKALGAQGGGHYRLTYSHSLEDFDARTAAAAQRNDIHRSFLDKWTNVVHAAGDVDSWADQLLDCAARIAAHYPQVRVWDFSVDVRQYLRSEEQNALLVRRPIHGSREDHRIGWRAVRGAKEIDVYARSNRGDASGLDVARKESAVLLGNRDDVIGLARVSDFGT